MYVSVPCMFNVHSARRGYWISRNWSYSVIPVQILRIGTGPLEDQLVFLSAKPSLQLLERAFFSLQCRNFFLKFSIPQTILVPIKIWALHLWNTICVIFTANFSKIKDVLLKCIDELKPLKLDAVFFRYMLCSMEGRCSPGH